MDRERIVVKIGSQSITTKTGELNLSALSALVRQIALLMQGGTEVVLVSSGAVASGRGIITSYERAQSLQDHVVRSQVLAALGQPRLMHAYNEELAKYSILGAQVLVTKEDFRTRQHYLNLHNAVEGMLKEKILPIINENDTVSIRELMFTDNDELAGLMAAQLSADRLIILSSVPGLLDGDPRDPAAKVIHEIRDLASFEEFSLSTEKTDAGRGGMQSKLATCLEAARLGTKAHIADARESDILLRLLADENIGTTFFPNKKFPARKAWIAKSVGQEKGTAWLTQKAVEVLTQHDGKARSILPVGVARVEGDFERGDLVRIVSPEGVDMGIGLAEYDAETARGYCEQQPCPPFIRYEHVYIHI